MAIFVIFQVMYKMYFLLHAGQYHDSVLTLITLVWSKIQFIAAVFGDRLWSQMPRENLFLGWNFLHMHRSIN